VLEGTNIKIVSVEEIELHKIAIAEEKERLSQKRKAESEAR
jgi:hypothetical protein